MPDSSLPSRCAFEALERRWLLSTIDITRFGAVASDGIDDTAALNAALRASAPGDTIAIPRGTFNISQTITLGTGRTLQGVDGGKLDFTVGTKAFAIEIEGNASNVTIDSLALRANCGIILMSKGSAYNNIQITNNDLVWGYNGTYYNRLAVRATVGGSGLIIERNYFHDSPTSDRNVDLWGIRNASYAYNKFYMINDGGHIMNPGDNVRYSFNVGRLIHRMGIEIQQTNYPPSHWPVNFVVEGNVFYDWNKPYWDSMGLSVPLAGINITIKNNYIRHNAWQGEWGQSDSSGSVRGSYGIEGPQAPAGQNGGIIEGNILGGERNVMAIAAPGRDTIARNNQIYGRYAWADIGGEPGSLGFGNVLEFNNLREKDFSKMPPPPEIGPGGGDPWPNPEPNPNPDPEPGPLPGPGGPTGNIPILSAYVIDGTRISLSWTDSYKDESGFKLERSLDGKTWQTVYNSYAAGVTKYTDKSLPTGTQFYYRVAAYKGSTSGQYSNIVAAKTPGSSPGGTTRGTQAFTSSNPTGPQLSDPETLFGLYSPMPTGYENLFNGSTL